MYIEPNTTIYILKDCPLDNTYEHTLYFGNKTEQANYFSSLAKFRLTQQTYQRVNKGVMRVQYKSDDLYDCNYIMFQNTNYGNKWFYAFIKSIEYVNNITSEITYEIDEIQSWFFDFYLQRCFVEREHAMSDKVGDNLVAENLETGEYVIADQKDTDIMKPNEWAWFVVATFDKNGNDAVGTLYQGLYSGLNFIGFTDYTDLSNFLLGWTASSKSTGVVSVIQVPKFMYDDWLANPTTKPAGRTIDLEGADTKFGNFTPHNNKLYTYPYTFLHVTNQNGSSIDYRYELWRRSVNGTITNKPKFVLKWALNTTPTITLIPQNYRSSTYKNENTGEITSVLYNTEEQITINNFPMCAYSTDAFKAWLAQNACGTARGVSGAMVSANKASENYVGGALSMTGYNGAGVIVANPYLGAGLMIASTLGNVATHSIAPPIAHGEQGGISNVQFDMFNFLFKRMQIQEQYARIIDSYFDRYGYATKITKIPNISGRPHWNYVKTIGCTITGSVPCDSMKKICAIHDNGVTYWKKGSEVGHYELDNRIGA